MFDPLFVDPHLIVVISHPFVMPIDMLHVWIAVVT